MAAITYLASTLLMGLVLLAIVVVVARSRNWRRTSPGVEPGDAFSRLLASPTTWVIVFAVAALGAAAGAVAVVGGAGVEVPGETVVLALAGTFFLLLAVYLFAGVYASARSKGMGRAPAVGLGSAVIGLLLLGLIVLQLLGLTGG